jgi:cell division protein FtsL
VERTLALPTADLIAPAARTWQVGARRLLPLWRHAVWLVALFLVLAAWVQVRLDVQQLRADLDRNNRMSREARIMNDRLRLEMDARRRASNVEQVAVRLGMNGDAAVVRVR